MKTLCAVVFGYLLWEIVFNLSLALGQPSGFVSIDCGSNEESYVDNITRITYISDSNLTRFGEIKAVPSNYTGAWPKQMWHLRTFPKGNRTCYTLQTPTPGTTSKYLLRTSFLYGNFDGLDSFPQFDLYLENTFVQTVNAPVGLWQVYEFIVKATRNYFTLCLCRTSERDPFISAIELPPIPDAIYEVVTATVALKMWRRSNFGTRDRNWYRYPNDTLDRFWWSPLSNNLDSINTTVDFTSPSLHISESISSTDSPYLLPSVVMQTAVINSDPKRGIQWSSTTIPQDADLFMCIHFAELKKLEPNDIREFNITVDSKLWRSAFRPIYRIAASIWSPSIYRSQNNHVECTPTEQSTLSPIVNGMELYIALQLFASRTNDGDASSLMDIRDKYQITKVWTGDPCLPINYTWEGLVCSNDTLSPRVISLDLSNSGLTGEIPKSLANLSAIVGLNLSGNNLIGNIPNFLATNLLQLRMFISGNEKLSLLNSCNTSERKGNVELIVGLAAVAAVLVVLVFWLAAIMVTNRRKPANKQPNGCQAFTHEEVIKVTNNFSRKIGEGGYGPVFHGHLQSGQNVAVKILSSKSSQGSQEFQTEVILLSRIHHKNLVSLIGYCDEAENMILIYEYISRGNLRDILSGRSEVSLDWNQRLTVAFGAAQGLDYLHSGCNPGIIHRDVKSTNILLNEKLEAKIADFGLSKTDFQDGVTHVSTRVVGTPGYLDPEYYSTNHLNEKSDVFSFGIVLLELISGLQPIIIEPSGERVHIVNWVAEIALKCVTLKAAERPAMSTVVSYLKEAIESGSLTAVSELESPSEPLRGAYALSSATDGETSVIYAAPSAR